MKKQITLFALMLVTTLIFSITGHAQIVPGGSDDGTGGGLGVDGGGTTGGTGTNPATNPGLTFNFGSTGSLTISASSPYYSCITNLLTYLHVTITNGIVNFPNLTCYTGCVRTLYYTGCINYTTSQSACKTPPAGCH